MKQRAANHTPAQRRTHSWTQHTANTTAMCALLFAAFVADNASAQRVLSYEEAYHMMLETNRDISIAQRSIEDAEIYRDQARSVFAPTLNVTGQYTLNDSAIALTQPNTYAPLSPYLDSVYDNDPDLQQFFADNPDAFDARELAGQPGQDITVRYRHDVRLSATASQILYDGRAFPGLAIARLQDARARNSVAITEMQLKGALGNYYFGAVRQQTMVRITEENLATAELTYLRASAAVETQTGTTFDQRRAEIGRLGAQRQVENARLAYQLSIQALAAFLDIDPDFDVEEPPDLPVPATVDPLIEYAMSERPDLEAADLAIEFDEARAREARSRFHPTVIAQGNAALQRASSFGGEAFTWNIAVIASWDIFDGGARSRDRRRAEISRSQNETRREQVEDTVRSELRAAWLETESARITIANAASELELAELNLELTREALQLGAAGALEVDAAQNQVFVARLALADARTVHRAHVYTLYRLAAASQEAIAEIAR